VVDVGRLQALSRDELIARARAAGVGNPEAMTRPELVDEIVRRTEQDAGRRRAARGWFGVARDLLASMVEQGLHLPDAAALIRGDANFSVRMRQPLSTVTLAEIYAAQGHLGRALRMLDEVLALEPDHHVARSLRERIAVEKVARGLPTEPPPGAEVELPVIPMSPPAPDPSPPDGAPGDGTEDGLASGAAASVAAPPDGAPGDGTEDGLASGAAASVAAPPDGAPGDGTEDGLASGAAAPEVAGVAAAADEPDSIPPTERHPSELRRESPVVVPAAPPAAPPASLAAAFWALRGGSFCVYWEIDAARRAAAEVCWPGGHLALAVLFACPRLGVARVISREIALAEPAGVVRLDAPRLDVAGRAALGWRRGDELIPLVVAASVDAPAPGAAARALSRARAALGVVA